MTTDGATSPSTPTPPAASPADPELPWAYCGHALVPAAEAALSANDLGLLRGDGCFETMWVKAARVVALDQHLERLTRTCRYMGLPMPAREALAAACEGLVAATPDLGHVGAECVLRLTLTAASLLIQLRPIGERGRLRREGLDLYPLPERRCDAMLWRHKTLAWTPNAVAIRRHPDGHAPRFEGLWLDVEGHVLEGVSTNIFAVAGPMLGGRDAPSGQGGRILTCPTTAPILPGTARARAIAHLRALGLEVVEEPFDLETLRGASEVFATSSTLPVAPVLRVDDAPLMLEGVNRPAGPVTRALLDAFARAPDGP